MSVRVFGRAAKLQVGTLVFEHGKGKSALDFDFSIEKTLSGNPNKAEIKVYNLSRKHRSELSKQKRYPLVFSAGYDEGTTMIFRGDIRHIENENENGNTSITTIEAQDGIDAHQFTRANLSFGRGAPVGDVVKALASAMSANGLGIGNVVEAAKGMALEGIGANTFAGGVSFSGQASKEMRKVVESTGHEYSVQDGSIQITKRGVAVGRSASLLTLQSGLVSAPVKDAKGVITAVCKILPDLLPGRQVEFRGTFDTVGQFRITACKYTGSTSGGDVWDAEITCKEI